MTLDDYRVNFRNALSQNTAPEEVESLCFIVLGHVLKMSKVDISLSRNRELSDKEIQTLQEILARLAQSEPIQYIIGSTEFYGLELQVNPATLIPRPETEELVTWVLSSIKNYDQSGLDILDIGTGSGCIAIAVAKNSKQAKVEALDISKKALAVATQNASANDVHIAFMHKNILHLNQLDKQYDIIISNPPYVRELERTSMHDNVLKNEPESALFVSNEDPLIFYRKIAKLAYHNLSLGGMLFFEINEYLGAEMLALLEGVGFTDVNLQKDMFGKDRMIKALR